MEKKINENPFKFHYYKHLWYLLIMPLYLLLFFPLEFLIQDGYRVSYLPIDDYIIFNEWFVISYVLWYPYMIGMGIYLMVRDVKGFKQYMSYIGVGFLSSVLFYAIIPNGQNLRPVEFERTNLLTNLVKYLYSIDTNTNVCPSMHVIGTMAVIFAVFTCKSLKSRWIRVATLLIGIAIILSTVYIKQHSILDVLVAIPWSIWVYALIYHRPSIKKSVKSEEIYTPPTL